MSFTNPTNLGVEKHEWLEKIDFYKGELNILQDRLLEVASKNTGAQSSAEVEHFQNQFILQKNNSDELAHKIREYTHHAFEDLKHHEGHVDSALMVQRKQLGEAVEEHEKILNELRHEFNQFLTRWM